MGEDQARRLDSSLVVVLAPFFPIPANCGDPMDAAHSGAASVLDHEKLEVYQLELHFLTWLTPLAVEVRQRDARLAREVLDQLDRASLSVALNTAEGNGKRQKRIRARFFDDARGSAMECAACLDALVAKGLASRDQVEPGKVLLQRVVSMLTKLVARFNGDGPSIGN